jgi:hypothetical protein
VVLVLVAAEVGLCGSASKLIETPASPKAFRRNANPEKPVSFGLLRIALDPAPNP